MYGERYEKWKRHYRSRVSKIQAGLNASSMKAENTLVVFTAVHSVPGYTLNIC